MINNNNNKPNQIRRDPAWIDNKGEYQQRDGPVPLYFCTTNARYDNTTNTTNYYSEMFLCAPWGGSSGLYHFGFTSKDCNSSEAMPIISEIYSNSGYECDSDNDCSVFNVRSNVINDTCQESEQEYDEFLVIADYCYVERDTDEFGNVNWRSIMATCDGTSAEYSVYDGVIGMEKTTIHSTTIRSPDIKTCKIDFISSDFALLLTD